MKNLSLLIFFLAITAILQAQTKEDTLAIKQTAIDYITGYYLADAELMENSLHPELVKRSIFNDKEGNNYIFNLGATNILYYASIKNKSNTINPDEDLKVEVIIFDIYKNIASIKLINNKFLFMDYMHIGKFKNEWKIVNVLWERVPKE